MIILAKVEHIFLNSFAHLRKVIPAEKLKDRMLINSSIPTIIMVLYVKISINRAAYDAAPTAGQIVGQIKTPEIFAECYIQKAGKAQQADEPCKNANLVFGKSIETEQIYPPDYGNRQEYD